MWDYYFIVLLNWLTQWKMIYPARNLFYISENNMIIVLRKRVFRPIYLLIGLPYNRENFVRWFLTINDTPLKQLRIHY